MTKLGYVSAALVLGFGGVAAAAIPGWARLQRTTGIEVADCAAYAARALQSVTGKVPTTTRLNANTIEIRSSTANDGIFMYCTASISTGCSGPIADLSMVTFSSAGSSSATSARDRVNAAFGNPQIIDCGPDLRPIME